MSCSATETYQRFKETYCFHLQGRKVSPARFSGSNEGRKVTHRDVKCMNLLASCLVCSSTLKIEAICLSKSSANVTLLNGVKCQEMAPLMHLLNGSLGAHYLFERPIWIVKPAETTFAVYKVGTHEHVKMRQVSVLWRFSVHFTAD